MYIYNAINETLRRRVKLEQLYDYAIEENLSYNGIHYDGYHLHGDIKLDASLGSRAVEVYLHEVAHLIAWHSDLSETPDSVAHNQYFALILAVMYRRANMLYALRIYDFCDTGEGQTYQLTNAPVLSAGELTQRFRYIMRRSAQLAKTQLTIEAIAKRVFEEDAQPHWASGEPATAVVDHHSGLPALLIGALGGALFTVATMAAASVFL